VKLSGPFRFSQAPYPYADVDPFMHALVDTFTPQRCVWASDWSFLRAPARLDYGPTLALLERWVPDAAARSIVLRETPARLFGFASSRP
jgi:predicted TIM-barrel fold metal-dependent hydrolase